MLYLDVYQRPAPKLPYMPILLTNMKMPTVERYQIAVELMPPFNFLLQYIRYRDPKHAYILMVKTVGVIRPA